ncbi:MAG: DUF3570 domain-containing protein [Calditrichota bacterium]
MFQRSKKRISLGLLALMTFSIFTPVIAEEGEALGYTTYYFSDSGGNSVSTTSFNLAKKLFAKTVLLLDLELDNVTVPPVTATTGATRPQREASSAFEKSRTQVIVGMEQGLTSDAALALTYYHSDEDDYRSNSAIATLTREYNQKNTTLTLRGQYIADEVGEILDDGSLFYRDKQSAWGIVGFDQVLSKTTVLSLSYDFLWQDGFLSDPYRQVRIFDTQGVASQVAEVHPGQRIRHAGSARINKLIPSIKASMSGSYRFYRDDWEVQSHTFDIEFGKYVFDELIAKFNYRNYIQDGAYFTRDRYQGDEFLSETSFKTQDYKLQSFYSNNIGLSVSYLFKKVAEEKPGFKFLENASIDLRYFRYFNSLDFSANIYQMNVNLGI